MAQNRHAWNKKYSQAWVDDGVLWPAALGLWLLLPLGLWLLLPLGLWLLPLQLLLQLLQLLLLLVQQKPAAPLFFHIFFGHCLLLPSLDPLEPCSPNGFKVLLLGLLLIFGGLCSLSWASLCLCM